MRYIKESWSCLMLLLVSFTLCTLVACGDDDDNIGGGNGQGGNIPENLIGTWSSTNGAIILFRADGTGAMRDVDGEKMSFIYKYDANASQITLCYADGDEDYYSVVSLSKSKLVAIDESGDIWTFTKGASAGDDDDDDDDLEPVMPTSSIVGTWGAYSYSLTWKFNADGTGVEIDDIYYDSFTYVYEESKKRLTLYYEDGEVEVLTVVSLTSTELVVKDEDGTTISFYRDRANDSNNSSSNISILGSWRCAYDTGYVVMQFKSDGTGTIRQVDTYWGEDDTEAFSYVYNSKDGIIYLMFGDDEPEIWEMTEESTSSRITVYDGEDFYTFVKIG